jgi:hypothetical protein
LRNANKVTLGDRPQLVAAELIRASAPISPSACSFELARDFRKHEPRKGP